MLGFEGGKLGKERRCRTLIGCLGLGFGLGGSWGAVLLGIGSATAGSLGLPLWILLGRWLRLGKVRRWPIFAEGQSFGFGGDRESFAG